MPTTTLYIRWSRLHKARARAAGAPLPRLPDYNILRERFGGWPQILAEAAPLFGTAASQPAAATAAPGQTAELDGPLLLDGARVRAVRQDRGIADAALRKAAGCPLSTWRTLVAGRAEAEPAVVQALCRTLGVAATEITVPAPELAPGC